MKLRHYFSACLAMALVATAAGQAQDPPKPKLIAGTADSVTKGDAGAPPKWVEIAADPILTTLQAPAASKWRMLDDGAELRVNGDGKTATFGAGKPGRYRLVVVPEGGEMILVAVLVGQQPVPPIPPPDPPKPVPPDPPKPPPAPVLSELGKKLQAAFDADPTERSAKLKIMATKAELYAQAATMVWEKVKARERNTAGEAVEVEKYAVDSTGALLARVKAAAAALGVDGLPDVRKVVAAELAAVMPADVALTAELRATAANVFLKVSNAIKEVR